MLIQDPEFMYGWWFRTHSLCMDVYSVHHSLCMDVDLGLHSLCMDVDSGNHSLCVGVDLGLQFMHRCWFTEPQFMCGCWFRAPHIYVLMLIQGTTVYVWMLLCVESGHHMSPVPAENRWLENNMQEHAVCWSQRAGTLTWWVIRHEIYSLSFSEIPLCVCVCVCVCMCVCVRIQYPLETYTRSTNIVPLSIFRWEIVWWETIPF